MFFEYARLQKPNFLNSDEDKSYLYQLIMDIFRISDGAKAFKASEIRELMKLANKPGIISFAGGMPDAEHFPVEEVTGIINSWTPEKKKAAFQYGATNGYPPLLDILQKRMGPKNILMQGQRIIITTGAQQAIYLLSKVLLNPGDKIIVESPTFIGAIASFKSFQADMEWITLEDDGMSVIEAEKKIVELLRTGKPPKFIYTIPNFQNPAGISMSQEKRKRLLDIAVKYRVPILEDDPYGDLYFEGKEKDFAPIKSLTGAREIVVYLNTFSKILSPGMRLGWVTGSEEIIAKMEVAKQSVDACSSSYTQVIAADYLEKGYVENYIAAMRPIYGEKCAAMLMALENRMPPDIKWSRPKGGFFVWLTLPENIRATEVFKRVVVQGVAFVTGAAFCKEGRGESHIRLAFSNSSLEEIEKGVEIIGKTLSEWK